MFDYEKQPNAIYEKSFATIHGEADLDGYSAGAKAVAVRMIHACGMVELARDIVISANAVEAGRAALNAHCDIICDVEMVKRGIIVRSLPGTNELKCKIGDPKVESRAKEIGNTKSAAAISLYRDELSGSVVVIGNAPTALFHLLELLQEGVAPPALIIGCPVGFVGAVESKQALIEHAGDIPFITVKGRLGGSAIAAAALNAIAIASPKTGSPNA